MHHGVGICNSWLPCCYVQEKHAQAYVRDVAAAPLRVSLCDCRSSHNIGSGVSSAIQLPDPALYHQLTIWLLAGPCTRCAAEPC